MMLFFIAAIIFATDGNTESKTLAVNPLTGKSIPIISIDRNLELIERMKTNPKMEKFLISVLSPAEKRFGKDASEVTKMMIQVKNGNYDGYDRYLSSPEFVAYALNKATNSNPNAEAGIIDILQIESERFEKTKSIEASMKGIKEAYKVKTVAELERIFNPNAIELLSKNPYSLEYATRKLMHVIRTAEKIQKHDTKNELLEQSNKILEDFTEKRNEFKKTMPVESNRAIVLAKQREIRKQDLYGYDGAFIIVSVVFIAYAGVFGEFAVVAIGSVLGAFSALKLMFHNGLNWKRTLKHIQSSGKELGISENDLLNIDKGFSDLKESAIFKSAMEYSLESKGKKAENGQVPIATPKEHAMGELSAVQSREVDGTDLKKLLKNERARSALAEIIIEQGNVERVINDPKVPADIRDTMHFLAGSMGAMSKIKTISQSPHDAPLDLTANEKVLLSHPNVLDLAGKLIKVEIAQHKLKIQELKKEDTADKDGKIEAENAKINQLEQMNKDIKEEAGLTQTGNFFRVAAPFVATVVVILKVSLKFFFIYECFNLNSFSLAFEAVALMSGKIYSGFLVASVASAALYKFWPQLSLKLKGKMPDYSDPKYLVDALADGVKKDHSMSIIQTTNRAILHPVETLSKSVNNLREFASHPKDSAKRTGARLLKTVKSGYGATKHFGNDMWSRVRGKGKLYSSEDKYLRELMGEVAKGHKGVEKAKEELYEVVKDPEIIREGMIQLSNAEIKKVWVAPTSTTHRQV